MNTLEKRKEINRKLFVFYKMIAWDLLFYFAIVFLFLNNVKGFSASQIFFADAFYPLFRFILQVPLTILIDKLGKRNSLIIANSFVSLFLFTLLILNNLSTYILANFFCAIGYTIKVISEPNLLYDSLEDSNNKGISFSKIDGKGSSFYYYINAASIATSGFLFIINAYIPLIISLIITLLTIFISCLFKEIPSGETTSQVDHEPILIQTKIYIKDLMESFKHILKSDRLKSLIIFNSIFLGLICVMPTLTVSLFSYINMSSKNIGIVFAILSLVSGFSSGIAYKIHLKFRNRSLSVLSIFFSLSILFTGIAVYIQLPYVFALYFILVFLIIQNFVKGPFFSLFKQYLSNFSTSNMRVKIFSANSSIQYISQSILTFICSYLVAVFPAHIAHIFLGGVSTLVIIFILGYMKTRVGLPRE